MCIMPHCRGGTGIKIAINLPAFFEIVDSVVTHNQS
jgi:hypothetical protein